MPLPERVYATEERDVDFPCGSFTTRLLPLGELPDCETDGHYRCWECKRKDPAIIFDETDGIVRIEELA